MGALLSSAAAATVARAFLTALKMYILHTHAYVKQRKSQTAIPINCFLCTLYVNIRTYLLQNIKPYIE